MSYKNDMKKILKGAELTTAGRYSYFTGAVRCNSEHVTADNFRKAIGGHSIYREGYLAYGSCLQCLY